MKAADDLLSDFYKLRTQAGVLRVTAERGGYNQAAQFAASVQKQVNDEIDLLTEPDDKPR